MRGSTRVEKGMEKPREGSFRAEKEETLVRMGKEREKARKGLRRVETGACARVQRFSVGCEGGTSITRYMGRRGRGGIAWREGCGQE